jgi:hypothetical protein
MTSMTAAAVPYAMAGYEVILDFSIPVWFLDTVRKVTSVKDVPIDLVILKPSMAVCAARAAARKEGAILDYGPFREFYADFDAEPRHLVQHDSSDPATLAAQIRMGLNEGLFRLH